MDASLTVHAIACHEGDETAVKLKPSARRYLFKRAAKDLSPEQLQKSLSTYFEYGNHVIHPESKKTPEIFWI